MESYELKAIGENPYTTFAVCENMSVFDELEVKTFLKTFTYFIF